MHNVVMIVGDWFGAHYLASAVASYVIVTLVGYSLHSRVTFGEDLRGRSLARYALAMAANYPATIVLLAIFCDVMHLPMFIASPISTILLILWNYFSSRWAIAMRPPKAGSRERPGGV
jgi:putative flippase GtrA